MKFVKVAILSSLVVPSVFAGPKVIYGEDNRLEVFDAPLNQQQWARSTATMVPSKNIVPHPTLAGVLQLNQQTLKQSLESADMSKHAMLMTPKIQKAAAAGMTFCEGTRFVDQPTPGYCSGFLIGPDLLVTAGHCVDIDDFCKDMKWVFDFQVEQGTANAGTEVKPENVYSCKRVVSSALSMFLGLDYGLIQLDRKVVGRKALPVRNKDKVGNSDALVVIGSPSGLPLKVAGGAKVRTNTHAGYFVANLDTFQGNSGSAVFNETTGVVEGILVRGEDDYRPNFAKMCIEAYTCKDNECRGEDVSRMLTIPEIAVQTALVAAAEAGNVAEIENLSKIKFWVDFYGADGQSVLIKAAAKGQPEVLKVLLAKGADVNLQDADGNNALHLAVLANSPESIKILVSAGGKADVKNAEGKTALELAEGNEGVASALKGI